jgi:LysM repeat protein
MERRPLSAKNSINQEASNIPETNVLGIPNSATKTTKAEHTEGVEANRISTDTITEKKNESLERSGASIGEIEDKETTDAGNAAIEKTLETKAPLQEKKKQPSRIIIVGRGDTLTGLTLRVYGTTNDDIIAMVKAVNPDLENIHFIKPGQRITLPPFDQTTEAR